MARFRIGVMFMGLGAGLLGTACFDPAQSCCECLVESSCWDSEICPDDPLGSCLYVQGSGGVPSYADGDGMKVCYAHDIGCEEDSCASECAGITGD